MKKQKETKLCKRCIVVEINSRKQYCDECFKITDDENRDRLSKIDRITKRKNTRIKLDQNFHNVNPSGQELIPNNFNKISSISNKSYTSHFCKEWIEVLKRYGKDEEFIDYLCQEYLKWQQENNRQSLTVFAKDVNISLRLIRTIDKENFIKLEATKSMLYRDSDYQDEFERVINHYGEIPTPRDFDKESKFCIKVFRNRFKLKGESYRKLLLMYGISNSQIEDALERGKSQKNEILRNANIGNFIYSNEELEIEFKRIVDSHINNYGFLPSFDVFKKESKIGTTTYQQRTNMSYLELAESYGYETENFGSKFELAILEHIKQILKEEYKSQATFHWLKSDIGGVLRCDGLFKNHDLIIEADGRQHFESIEWFGGEEAFERIKANDQIKNTLIPQHNLKLIRIAYDEPYHDFDFLKIRLIEHGIIPPNHTVITDSIQAIKSAS